MAEKRVIELEIQDNSKTLKQQYKEAVVELQRVAEAYGETSQQAAEAARKAAGLKDQIEDTNDLLSTYKGEGTFIAMGKAMTAVASGFSAIEGGLGLVGVESEKLQETMLRVQSAMALAQGLEGLEDAGRAFSVLQGKVGNMVTKAVTGFKAMTGASKAFLLTGIGLLIAAVGLLIANMDKLQDVFSTTLGKAKEFEKTTSEQAETARRAVENFAEYERTLKRLGYTEDEINTKRKKRFKEAIERTKAEIEASKKVYEEQLKNLKTVNTFDKLGLNATGRMLFGDEETAKDQRKKVSELRDQLAKLKNDEFQFEEDIKAKKKQAAEEEKQRQQELIDKEKEKRKAIQDRINDELAQIKENNRLALAENQARLRTEQEQAEFEVNEKYNAQIALAKKYKKDTTQLELAQANEINEIRLKYQEEEYAKAEELRQKELAAIKEANRLKAEAEEQFQAQIEAIDEANFQAGLQKSMTEDEYALELVRQKYFALEEAAKGNAEQLAIIEAAKALEIEAIDKKSKDKQVAAENELRQKRLQLAGQAFTAIGDIIGSFTAKNDKDARKQFEIQKAFNLAAAVTNTAMAVTGALTAGGNPIKLATGTQFVEAGIAGAVGAANIIKIASSRFGGGGGGGGGSAPSPAAGASVMSPNFSVIGSSGVNQLAQLQQQPVQAFVVSGEVTSQQALDRNRVQNATL